MADFSRSHHHRNQHSSSTVSSSSISAGNDGFAGKSVYDDVFVANPKVGVRIFSSRVEDYSEIFGSSRGSIPILDLPSDDELEVSIDVRSSGFDYSEVFGGIGGVDFDVLGGELVDDMEGGRSSSDEEVWTPPETRSPSEMSDAFDSSEENQVSHVTSHQSFDGVKQFNESYQETNQINKDETDGTTHKAHIDAAPEFTCVIDEKTSSLKAEVDKPLSPIKNDPSVSMNNSEENNERKIFQEAIPHIHSHGAEKPTSESDDNHKSRSVWNGSYSTATFQDTSDSKRPMASRYDTSKREVSDEDAGSCSPTSFGEEVDENSVAAASAAALRKAIDMAQARIRIARESVEKNREGFRSANLSFKESLKVKEIKKVKSVDEGYKSRKKWDKDIGKQGFSVTERSDSGAGQVVQDFKEMQKPFIVEDHTEYEGQASKRCHESLVVAPPFEQVDKSKILGSPNTDEYSWKDPEKIDSQLKEVETADEWEESEQNLDAVKGAQDYEENVDKSRFGGEEVQIEETVAPRDQEQMEEQVIELNDKCEEQKGDEKQLGAHEWDESEDEIGEEFQECLDTEKQEEAYEHDKNEEVTSFNGWQKCEKGAKESWDLKENDEQYDAQKLDSYNEMVEESLECLETANKVSVSCEQEDQERKEDEKAKKKEPREQEENEKKHEEAHELEENEKTLNERIHEVNQQEEYEERINEAFEFVKHEKELEGSRDREDSKYEILEGSLEYLEIKKKVMVACEREEYENRSEEAFEQDQYERIQEEAREHEEKERKREEDHEEEENEKRVNQDSEIRQNETMLEEQYEQEECEKRVQGLSEDESKRIVEEAHEQERNRELEEAEEEDKNVNILKEAYQMMENERKQREARECEEDEWRQRPSDPREENAITKSILESSSKESRNHIESDDACEHDGSKKPSGTWENSERVEEVIEVAWEPIDYGKEPERGMGDATETLLFEVNLAENNLNTAEPENECNKEEPELARDMGEHNQELPEEKESEIAFDEEEETMKIAQEELKRSQNTGNEPIPKETFTVEEREIKESSHREVDLEKQLSRNEEREKEREREKDRKAVERAIHEARERAYAELERAAVEKANAEARQRLEAQERLQKVSEEARERAAAEKANAEARQRLEAQERLQKVAADTKDKLSAEMPIEAKRRAERAAVDRAILEAHERALEKAMSGKAASGTREQEPQHGSGPSRNSRSSNNGVPHASDGVDEAKGESAQRTKAKLERNQRTVERVAKVLEEKNMRDYFAQKEQAERNRLSESLDAEIKRWLSGKERNLRALLSTLQYILGPESGWQPIPLTDMISTNAVKKAYRKATLCVHPDKLQQRGASIQQKYICEKVFDLLKDAWNKFEIEER